MNIPSAKHYRRQNYLHSLLLLITMLGLLALIGWLVFGPEGFFFLPAYLRSIVKK